MVGVWLLLNMSLAACSSSDTQARYRRDSGVYAAIVQSLVGTVPATAPGAPVYLSPIDDASSVPLEVQASVIKKLAPRIDAKFVDSRQQALDDSLAEVPVLDDGLLLVVPKVPASGETFELRVERYRTASDRSLVRIEVRDADPTALGWVARVLSEEPLTPTR